MASEAATAAVAPGPSGPRLPSSASRRDFYWLRSFIAGGVAGCCAKTTIAPLDRVKILLQAHNHHYKHLGVISTLCAVPKKEGYLGLYKGNGAMMIRIFPYGAIQFTAFGQYKKIIKKKLGISGHIHRLMAGSMAGITAVICTYPLDMVRARLAFQVKGEDKYTGIIHAFKTIYTKEGGMQGFYRGLTPTIVGMAPYAGVPVKKEVKKKCPPSIHHHIEGEMQARSIGPNHNKKKDPPSSPSALVQSSEGEKICWTYSPSPPRFPSPFVSCPLDCKPEGREMSNSSICKPL